MRMTDRRANALFLIVTLTLIAIGVMLPPSPSEAIGATISNMTRYQISAVSIQTVYRVDMHTGEICRFSGQQKTRCFGKEPEDAR